MITFKQYMKTHANTWTFSPLTLFFTDAKIKMGSLEVKKSKSGWNLFIKDKPFKNVMKTFETKMKKVFSDKMKTIMGRQLPSDLSYNLSYEIPTDEYIIDDIDNNYAKEYNSYAFVWSASITSKDVDFMHFLKMNTDVAQELSKEFKTQKLRPLLGKWPGTA